MNFLEAVKAMKEGKKVRRGGWNKDNYLYLETGEIIKDDSGYLKLPENFEATDWEIVEEKKTLSDKIFEVKNQWDCIKDLSAYDSKDYLPLKDVKEAIKEFIDWLFEVEKENVGKSVEEAEETVRDKAKEIFGERLI